MPEHPSGLEKRVDELERQVAELKEHLAVINRSLPGCNVRYVKAMAEWMTRKGEQG